MADLAEMQYELGGVVFGRDTPWTVQSVDFGSADIRNQDEDLAREDGVRFGVDYRGSRKITVNFNVLARGQALDLVNTLEGAWLADSVRQKTGEVTTLRMRRNGRTRRVYGRPRKFASTTGRTLSGWIPCTAEFATADHLFYDDDPTVETFQIASAPDSGLVVPLVAPLSTTTVSSVPGSLPLSGKAATWLQLTVHGPISRPVIEAVGLWKLTLDVVLAADEYVDIDPRPWSRHVLRNGVANIAGDLTPDSPLLSEVKLPPGQQQVVLRGLDPTGTASITMTARSAWSTY